MANGQNDDSMVRVGCVPRHQRYRSFITAGVAFFALTLSLSCNSRVDQAGAKALTDSFMADLVANRLDDAISKMAPAFIQKVGGRENAIRLIQTVSGYCGRPLNSAYLYEKVGVHYFEGRVRPMRSFSYTGPTTQHPEGRCLFEVNVVPGDQRGYMVVQWLVGRLPR